MNKCDYEMLYNYFTIRHSITLMDYHIVQKYKGISVLDLNQTQVVQNLFNEWYTNTKQELVGYLNYTILKINGTLT